MLDFRLPLGHGTMLKLTWNLPSPFSAKSTPVPHSEQRLLMKYLQQAKALGMRFAH